MTESLGTAIQDEIKRNYELVTQYKELGSVGTFGATLIQKDLDDAHQALKDDDVVAIMRVYQKLKENK